MKSIILGVSDNHCKHCNKRLYWRTHKQITQKQLRQPFYFSKWEYCLNGCHAVWLHDEFKVWNKNAAARQQKDYEEYDQQMSFIRSI